MRRRGVLVIGIVLAVVLAGAQVPAQTGTLPVVTISADARIDSLGKLLCGGV